MQTVHFKKIAVSIMLAVLVFELVGAEAPSAASSVTAYINKTTYVYAKPSTSSARVRVARGTKVEVLAVRSSWARVKRSKYTAYIQTRYLSKKPPATPTPRPTATPRPTPRPTVTPKPTPLPTGTAAPTATAAPTVTPAPTGVVTPSWRRQVERVEWFNGGSKIVKRGGYAYIYDIDTGLTLRIKRKGGTNHMDVEPASKKDTATLKKIAGGTFSWESHAVVLIKGGRYIAAAINTQPHGEYTIKDNDFPGQFCLHMVGSRTHETNKVNPEHQKSIERVLKWSTSS